MRASLSEVIAERCVTCQARSSCLFFGLSPDVLGRFQEITKVRPYHRGATIFQQGEDVCELYVIRSGWARLFWCGLSGKRKMVGLVGGGGILGLMEVFAQARYEVTAEVVQDCIVEQVDKTLFLSFLQNNPSVAVELLASVSREARKTLTGLCANAENLPFRDRLLHVLQEFAGSCGQETLDGIRLRVPFTVEDLADSVGCSRQWASKALRELEEQGLVKREKGWIIITGNRGTPRLVTIRR